MVKVALFSVIKACRNKFPTPTIDEQAYIDFTQEIAAIDKKTIKLFLFLNIRQ